MGIGLSCPVEFPAAWHACRAGQLTPKRLLWPTPTPWGGFGVGKTDQFEPMRRSAMVMIGPNRVDELPVATHTGPSGQDTLASEALSAPAGFGAVCSPQV